MDPTLSKINNLFQAGQVGEARRSLVDLLVENPDHGPAWKLLETLFPDPADQAECCRQVLAIEPGNRQAANWLLAAASQPGHLPSSGQENKRQKDDLLCSKCGAPLEISFVGEMRDKRARCAYCGHEIDLPDSYQRVQKIRETLHHPGGKKIVEKTIFEARQDGDFSQADLDSLPEEARQLLDKVIESGPDVLDEAFLDELKAYGIQISINPDAVDPLRLKELQRIGYQVYGGPSFARSSQTVITRIHYRDRTLEELPFYLQTRKERQRHLFSPGEIFRRVGTPLQPTERTKCPNPKCGATISKHAEQCQWCGKALPPGWYQGT